MAHTARTLIVGLLGTVIALLPCAWAGSPAQAQGACSTPGACLELTVTSANESFERAIPVDDLTAAHDQSYRIYALRYPGRPDEQDQSSYQSTSIRQVLIALLHLDPDVVDSVRIVDPSDTSKTVILNGSTHDFDAPESPDFPYVGGEPPVFFERGKQIAFLRARRQADDADYNGLDGLQGPVLRAAAAIPGRILHPSLTASANAIKNGDPPITLTAGNFPVGSRFAWDYQDGSDDGPDRSTTTHSFAGPTTYDVTVFVNDGAGGAGIATTRITVGPRSDANGPIGGGGGNENGTTTGGLGQGRQAGGVRGKGSAGQGGPGARGSAENGTGDSAASPTGPTSISPDRAATRQRGKQKQEPVADGERVNGILIDAALARAVPQPTGSSPKVASATTRKATDLPTDWRWLLAGVPVLLLGLGSATRSRWLNRRLPEPPWRSS